jgi:hypothetical protein
MKELAVGVGYWDYDLTFVSYCRTDLSLFVKPFFADESLN